MGSRRFNLNNYETTTKEEATTELIPFRLSDGTQPPTIYLKSKRKKVEPITLDDINAGRAEWSPRCQIDVKCDPKDYQTLVDWWFDHAVEDEVYRTNIRSSYEKLIDLSGQINRIKSWLQTKAAFSVGSDGRYNRRKKDLDAFLNNCLRRNLNKQDQGR